MQLTILTPERSLFDGQVTSVKVPGVNGQFQVLKNHAAIVSALTNGQVEVITSSGSHKHFNDETGNLEEIQDSGKQLSYTIKRGFIEVNNNHISLLVTTA